MGFTWFLVGFIWVIWAFDVASIRVLLGFDVGSSWVLCGLCLGFDVGSSCVFSLALCVFSPGLSGFYLRSIWVWVLLVVFFLCWF